MKYIFYISFTLLAIGSKAQISFQKTFGSHQYEYAEEIIQLYDTGYATIGSSSLSGSSSDVYLLRIDSLGNYLWSKTYGGNQSDNGESIKETTDSGFVIAGHTNSFGAGGFDAYLIKTDKDGNLEWQKTYGGSDWDFAHSVILMPDGGYVIAGETYSSGLGNNDAYIIRTDSLGNSLWQRTFGTAQEDKVNDIFLAQDGFLYATGTTNGKGSGTNDAYVLKLDLSGNLIWEKSFGSLGDDQTFALSQHKINNLLVLFGYTNGSGAGGYDYLYVTTNYAGDSLGFNTKGTAEDDFGYDIAYKNAVPNAFWSVGASVNTGSLLKDYHYFYVTTYGTYISSNTYGWIGDEIAKSISDCNDESFIMAGHTVDLGNGGTDIFLVKLYPNLTVDPNITQELDITSSSGIEKEFSLDLYPNPCADFLELNFNSHENVGISLFDLKGKEVFNRKNIASGDKINISNIAKGAYIARVFLIKNQSVNYSVKIFKY